jgi:hypothetical protein
MGYRRERALLGVGTGLREATVRSRPRAAMHGSALKLEMWQERNGLGAT